MNPKELKENLDLRKDLEILQKDIREYLDLFLEVTSLEKIDFYQYNFEYDEYTLDFSITASNSTATIIKTRNYHIILKLHNIALGKILFYRRIQSTKVVKMILSYLRDKLYAQYNISTQFKGNELNLNIFLYSNSSTKVFAKKLQNDVSTLFNANILLTNNLRSVVSQIESKTNRNIILYTISDYEDIRNDEELLSTFNDFVIVYGPNDHRISLLCGKLNIQYYIAYDDYQKEYLRDIILETKDVILNKFSSVNNIISISGISGGIGCTTIAMNMANILAKKMPDHNILFIDLANTKAISNLFLEQNPLPEKTIIDLIESEEFNIENNLKNGLVCIRDNFYCINGIQKHIDKEYLEKDTFIEKFLNYLELANHYFNTIIIDTGVFEASDLKTTIYDVSNEIELVTQMNLPDISKLKTLYSLIKRAGLKEKTSFIVNRFDAKSALSLEDVISILHLSAEDKMIFKYKIPNDYLILGKHWNQCELVSNSDENSLFVREITEFLTSKYVLKKKKFQQEKKGLFSFFRK